MKPENISVFPMGEKNEAFAQYFVGQSYLNMLSTERVTIGNVTFEPGCRNNWHIHHAKEGGGQILICTARFLLLHFFAFFVFLFVLFFFFSDIHLHRFFLFFSNLPAYLNLRQIPEKKRRQCQNCNPSSFSADFFSLHFVFIPPPEPMVECFSVLLFNRNPVFYNTVVSIIIPAVFLIFKYNLTFFGMSAKIYRYRKDARRIFSICRLF